MFNVYFFATRARLLLFSLVVLYLFGSEGYRGRLVPILGDIGLRGGDRSPGFAAGHAQCHGAACQQGENDSLDDFVDLFRFHKSLNRLVLCFVVLPAACP